MKNEKYLGYTLYYDEKKDTLNILKLICTEDYKVLEIYKNTERNYVVKIEINNKEYILKKPKAETVIPQRRVQTFFKEGEALTTLINYLQMKKYNFNFFPEIYGVGVKKGLFIEESFILMEVIKGEELRTCEDIDEIIRIIKKLHSVGVYHGDLNASNFIKTDSGLKVIDTQCKNEKLTDFHRSYDIITLEKDLLVRFINYNVRERYMELEKNEYNILDRKSIWYSFAYIVKNFKRLKWIEKIRSIKQKLRVKGWKI